MEATHIDRNRSTGPLAWMASHSVAANLLMGTLLLGGLFWGSRIKQELFPDFEKHARILKIEVRDIDHPLPEGRTWPGFYMPEETPVRKLYKLGDGVALRGLIGTSGSAESGKRVVELVKKQVRPT